MLDDMVIAYEYDEQKQKAFTEHVQQQEKLMQKDKLYSIRSWKPSKIHKSELPEHIKRDPFLYQCFKRLHYDDKNILMIVTGETGVGKSISAVHLGMLLDVTPLGEGKFRENFVVQAKESGEPTPETRIIFSALDLVRLVRSGLPKGSVIIWDEAGIGNDNTNWQDKKAKLVKHLLQSFRAQNLCLILTVPDEESVALSTRRLVHCILNVKERDDNFAYIDIQWLDRNRRMDRVYRKTTSFNNPETGAPTKIANYMMRPIAKRIEKEYKRIKSFVLDDMNAFTEREMSLMEKLEVDKLEKKEEAAMRNFELIQCADFIRNGHMDESWDKAKEKYSPHKIIYILAQNNWKCTVGQARTIIANLPPKT